MHPLIRESVAEARELVRGAFLVMREKRAWILAFVVAVAAVGLSTFPHDVNVHHWLTDQRVESIRMFAQYVSKWGDYTTGTFIIVAGLWIAGALFKRPAWRRAAIACLLAASCAGLLINPIRAVFGRPRPNTEVQDGFTGPNRSKKYHSFPSGHAGTSFGTATALAVAAPAIGVPALAGAALVGWSRMYVREHYLTDVLVGASIGTLFGVAFGIAARRRKNFQPLEESV
jgi:membrane-associated phospholipid phosphatase